MNKKGWYTEEWAGEGSAISLKIKQKVHDEQSPYQRIEIYETETFGTLMTLDGLVMVTDRDNFIYHEMMTHPALFTHPSPKRVLIIGGGDCGSLREVLKHPEVELVEQVELDERVTRVTEKFFPDLCESNNDARAKLHFADGIQWAADAKPESYDVIIVDSTDPVGPAAGLFSEDFYRNCLKALTHNGAVVGQSESPLFHARLIRSKHDAGAQERQCVAVPRGRGPQQAFRDPVLQRRGTRRGTRGSGVLGRYVSLKNHRGLSKDTLADHIDLN